MKDLGLFIDISQFFLLFLFVIFLGFVLPLWFSHCQKQRIYLSLSYLVGSFLVIMNAPFHPIFPYNECSSPPNFQMKMGVFPQHNYFILFFSKHVLRKLMFVVKRSTVKTPQYMKNAKLENCCQQKLWHVMTVCSGNMIWYAKKVRILFVAFIHYYQLLMYIDYLLTMHTCTHEVIQWITEIFWEKPNKFFLRIFFQ